MPLRLFAVTSFLPLGNGLHIATLSSDDGSLGQEKISAGAFFVDQLDFSASPARRSRKSELLFFP
jgi:hypothetical protein